LEGGSKEERVGGRRSGWPGQETGPSATEKDDKKAMTMMNTQKTTN
jgi:hypothetical protein